MMWDFRLDGTPVLRSMGDMDVSVRLTKGKLPEKYTIKQVDCAEGSRGLGVWKAPSANQQAQFEQLKNKSDLLARSVVYSHLSRYNAWTGY